MSVVRTIVRLRRLALWVLLALVVSCFGPPLVLRGPALRWLAGRASASRCGHFAIAGGHMGWTSVIRLVLGRPVQVTIDGLSIAEARGRPVLELRRLEVAAVVRLSPLRVTMTDARLTHGQWRLASDAHGHGSADAFLPLPPGGRGACGVRGAAPAAWSGSAAAALVVERGALADVDVDLDFPAWRLSLAHTSTTFSLAVDGGFRFDVGRAAATAATLRIGPLGSAWTAVVPFDSVAIDRVAVVPDAAADLVLVVGAARSGSATLAGDARFHNVIPVPGADPEPAGLDVDARWRAFGGALARLEASWRPPGDWPRQLDGDLHLSIRGAFNDLSATVEAQTDHARVAAELASGVASLRFDSSGVDTSWLMAPALRPLLGGRLRGGLAAWLRLSPTLRGLDAELTEADLRLDRHTPGHGPEQLVLRVGAAAAEPPAPRTLSGAIRRVRVACGRLDIADVRLRWGRLWGRAGATIDFAADTASSAIDATGKLAVGSLEDWVPRSIARGRLHLSARLVGALERFRLDMAFTSPSRLTIGEQPFRLPAQLALRRNEDGLRVAPFRLRAERGGEVELSGRLDRDERIAASAAVRDFPLQALPWLGAQMRALGVTGQLGADLTMTGAPSEPALGGSVVVSTLALRGKPIGPTRATLAWQGDRGRLAGRVGTTLGFRAKLRRSPRLAVDAELSAAKLALAPWLPPPLLGAPIAASGKARVVYEAGAAPQASASLELSGPGLDGVTLDVRPTGEPHTAHLGGCIDLAAWPALWARYLSAATGLLRLDLEMDASFTGPVSGDLVIVRDLGLRPRRQQGVVHLFAGDRVHIDGDGISSPGLRIDGPWFRGHIAGRVGTGTGNLATMPLALTANGTVDLGRLSMPSRGVTVAGRVTVDAGVHGTLGPDPGPSLTGKVVLTSVVLRWRSFPAVTLQGTVVAEGSRLTARALAIDIARAGRVVVGEPSGASVTLLSFFPLRLGPVDVPFSGQNLTITSVPIQIREVDVAGQLAGVPGALTLTGDIRIAGGVLHRSSIEAPRPGPRRPWYSAIPPGLSLDLRLRGPRDALRVTVPLLPDVTVDFDCRLRADRYGASLSGNLRGDGVYDRTAVHLYAWLTARQLRRCQLDGP